MAEKSMKTAEDKMDRATYIKPISAYIGNGGMPISSLYQPISKDGERLYQAYISLYRKMGDAYIKPISAYITGWGNAYIKPIYAYIKKWRKPISSLYRLISLEGRSDTDEIQISCFHP